MRVALITIVFAFAQTCNADREAVLKVVQAFFDTMTARTSKARGRSWCRKAAFTP